MATRYISTFGLDTNSGSRLSPWKTIAKVNSSSVAGDTLFFHSGHTFTDAALTLKNQQDVYVYNGTEKFVINRSDASACIIFNGVTAFVHNVKAMGPTTGSPTLTPISFTGDVSNSKVYDSEIEGGFDSLTFDGSASGTGIVIDGITIRNSWNDGISFNGTVSNVRVSRYDIRGVGIVYQGSGAGDAITTHDTATFTATDGLINGCWRGIVNINEGGENIIERTLFIADSNTGGAGGVGSALVGHGGIGGTTTIRNCIVFATGANQTNIMGCSLGNLNVYNNTIISKNTASDTYTFRNDTAGTITRYNTISYIENGAHRHVKDDINTTVANYNCYYPDGAALFQALTFDGDFATWQSLGKDADGTTDDPFLVNTSNPTTAEDARLAFNSPVRDLGTNLTTTGGFTNDYFDYTRLVGNDWDMGAIQFTIQTSRAMKDLLSSR